VRARYYGNHKYQGLKDILLKALDQQPLPTAIVPTHGRLAQPRFARTAAELLQLDLEDYHEPN